MTLSAKDAPPACFRKDLGGALDAVPRESLQVLPRN